MAKLSELVRGFRANVREGIPSQLTYDGAFVELKTEDPRGVVGICKKTTPERKK